MIKRWVGWTILILVALNQSGFSQESDFDQKDFFMQLKNSYYTLKDTPKENFTALVTSTEMEAFADSIWDNPEVFPLQLIWFNPDRLYLSQLGVPTIKEGKVKAYQDLVNRLKQQVRGILTDLQRFYMVGLYETIPDDYEVRAENQFVIVEYEIIKGQNLTRVEHMFGKNARCLEIRIHYPDKDEHVTIVPEYRTVKTKWLCNGWTVQTKRQDEIVSGFKVSLELGIVDDVWVPHDFVLTVQTSEAKGRTYFDRIKFRNYLFNQSIRLQNSKN